MDAKLKEKMLAYYAAYYRDDCSLPDWEARAGARLGEEGVESGQLKRIQNLIGKNFLGQTHCIVGAGTGGLAVTLKQEYNANVYGVEPYKPALEIIHDRCRENNIPTENFTSDGGEKMPFADNFFDFVHCYTVLEHVRSIPQCIDEMIRVVKPGGIIYINTPNYRYPYERHYKTAFPTFIPKFLGALYLRARGRSPQFLKTINFVTERMLNTLLYSRKDIVWMRVYKPQTLESGGIMARALHYLVRRWFIYPNQEIIIIKNEDNKLES